LGPVMWDIDGEDWRCWQNQDHPRTCAERYIRLLSSRGRGILLLHDNAAEQELATHNRTFIVVQLLVSWLGANGFHILPVSEIPQLRLALPLAQSFRAEHPTASCPAMRIAVPHSQ
jgi:hypothetical protein